MGFLTTGSTLTWDEASTKPTDFVREHGITQFLNIYWNCVARNRESLLWGDEIEYIVLNVDHQNSTAKLCLRGSAIGDQLSHQEEGIPGKQAEFLWRPEYGRYMVEGTPGQPYGRDGLKSLIRMQTEMERRRISLETALNKDQNEEIVSMTNFPLLGAIQSGPYLEPHYEAGGPVALSLFTPDEIIHPHFRFSTLTANIRKRRGAKVFIEVPLYRDANTNPNLPLPPVPPQPSDAYLEHRLKEMKSGQIYMDSMAFGMGMCCLQVTFQCCNIDEARYFYDQLAVMSPIMLAMTAATPFFRGYISDIDARWNVICASVDDRTLEERGQQPLKKNRFVINKSRYGSIDCYISKDKRLKPQHNDLDLVYDKDICKHLMEQGIDELLARHIAHLFIRDPLVIYKDKIAIDDTLYSDHFENIQSTNWQTVRFKPPPPNSDIGWRVEFRPMEIQLTDFENAAYSMFIVLLTRVLSAFNLNFYIPITKVDANMETAHQRNSIQNDKFYFRKNLSSTSEDEYELMTINEIMNGKIDENGTKFHGLIELANVYLDTINVDVDTRKGISKYLDFISAKASGKLMSTASYLRHEVMNHPDYQKDSIITPKMNYDLICKCIQIGHGEYHPGLLLGDFKIEPLRSNIKREKETVVPKKERKTNKKVGVLKNIGISYVAGGILLVIVATGIANLIKK